MNEEEKKINEEFISKQIKNITLQDADKEFEKLKNVCDNGIIVSPNSRLGNKISDLFTFKERLKTKGKYNVNYYEFLENIEEFKKKKFIQTMVTFYENKKNKNKTKNEYIVLKEIYNICISAINIMKPLNCIEIYKKYNSKRVLNFCVGWGASIISSGVINLEAHYGVEINTDLKEPYDKMLAFLKPKCATYFDIQMCDSLDVDYSLMDYDTVFTSPPYYFIEKYPNNVLYNSKKEMDEKFYKPIFTKTYNGLKLNGYYIINVCKEVYDNVLVLLLGEAHEMFPLKKSKRQNNYVEMIYVWQKRENELLQLV